MSKGSERPGKKGRPRGGGRLGNKWMLKGVGVRGKKESPKGGGRLGKKMESRRGWEAGEVRGQLRKGSCSLCWEAHDPSAQEPDFEIFSVHSR